MKSVRFKRSTWLASAVFISTALFGYAMFWFARESTRDRIQVRLVNEAANYSRQVENRFSPYAVALRAIANEFEAHPETNRDAFDRFVGNMDLCGPDFTAALIGYSKCYQRSELESLNGGGTASFYFPKGKWPRVVAIRHVFPHTATTRPVIGYDMMSDPIRAAAVLAAEKTATAVASRPVKLLVDPSVSSGIVICMPVFRNGDIGVDRHLDGVAFAAIRVNQLLSDLFPPKASESLALTMHLAEGARSDEPFFRSSNFVAEKPAEISTTISLYGQRFRLEFQTTPTFARTGPIVWRTWVPALGILTTILLTLITFLQTRGVERLKRAADELELRQRALAKETRSVEVLNMIGVKLAAELDPNVLVQFVIDRSTPLLDARYGIFCYTVALGALERLSLYATCGPVPLDFVCQVDSLEKVAWNVLREQSTTQVKVQLGSLSEANHLLVPVISREGPTIGLLAFAAKGDEGFSDSAVLLAKSLAAHSAVALDNARLFSEKEVELTERRRAEARWRDLNDNLEKLIEVRTRDLVAANQELESFAYSIAHDLRTPLRSVNGFTTTVLEGHRGELPEGAIADLERVRKAARRMDELITALLTLSRLTRSEIAIETLDLTELARQACFEVIQSSTIDVSIHPGMVAQADARLIGVLLTNLLTNAVKFSSSSTPPRIEIGQVNDEFFVRDNGVGFDPQHAGRLFQPFERLHTQQEFAGHGIGLATVDRIVRRHGGRIRAESKVGGGATFWFTLHLPGGASLALDSIAKRSRPTYEP